ncbi:MAG: hypothetical protein Q8R28_22310 [Dehalococcoidia bacterium]|nr:hypothetical protein [Dehalococcoidia bacterium]
METPETTVRMVRIISRQRDINSRGKGSNIYAMIGLPGSHQLIWADRAEGAEYLRQDYPRNSSIRAADRRGSDLVRVPLPVGALILWIDKGTDGRVTRSAVRVTADGGETADDGAIKASTLPDCTVVSRRRGGGWVTVIDGEEWS